MIAPLPPSITSLLAAIEAPGKIMLNRPGKIGQRGDEIAPPILVHAWPFAIGVALVLQAVSH